MLALIIWGITMSTALKVVKGPLVLIFLGVIGFIFFELDSEPAKDRPVIESTFKFNSEYNEAANVAAANSKYATYFKSDGEVVALGTKRLPLSGEGRTWHLFLDGKVFTNGDSIASINTLYKTLKFPGGIVEYSDGSKLIFQNIAGFS